MIMMFAHFCLKTSHKFFYHMFHLFLLLNFALCVSLGDEIFFTQMCFVSFVEIEMAGPEVLTFIQPFKANLIY